MWAIAQADAGELWLFGDEQLWGDVPWRAHVHWRRRREREVMISGLKASQFNRDAYRTILAELGRRFGFTTAAYFRMKQGKPVLKEGIKIMADEVKMDVTVSITWTEPGDSEAHVTSQLYPNKDHAFVAEVQRRVMKGLQTPA